MQDKSQVKTNILRYIDYKGISKYQFYKETGITRGILDQNNGISEENIAKFIAYVPNINIAWLITGIGDMMADGSEVQKIQVKARRVQERRGIPLIPASAFGDNGELTLDTTKIDYFYDIPEFSNADFLLRITDNSMFPKLSVGDIVACFRIVSNLYFQWNKVYALYSRSQGVLVRRIRKPDKEGFLLLVSENKEFLPFEIPLSDISAYALVVGTIKVE